jgi:hypothetical protein
MQRQNRDALQIDAVYFAYVVTPVVALVVVGTVPGGQTAALVTVSMPTGGTLMVGSLTADDDA